MWRCTVCKFLAKTEWDKEAHWHRVVDVKHLPHLYRIAKAAGEGMDGFEWMFYEIDDKWYGPRPVDSIGGGWNKRTHKKR